MHRQGCVLTLRVGRQRGAGGDTEGEQGHDEGKKPHHLDCVVRLRGSTISGVLEQWGQCIDERGRRTRPRDRESIIKNNCYKCKSSE